MNCQSCNKELELVFEDFDSSEKSKENPQYQYRDAIWLGFFGGYGMFIDNIHNLWEPNDNMTNGDIEAVICKECIEKLLKENPWLNKLFEEFYAKDFYEENI